MLKLGQAFVKAPKLRLEVKGAPRRARREGIEFPLEERRSDRRDEFRIARLASL
jgi:hypothetical protein